MPALRGASSSRLAMRESCLSTVCATPVPPVNVPVAPSRPIHVKILGGNTVFAFHTELPALLVSFFAPFLKIMDGAECSHGRRDYSQLGSGMPPRVDLTVFPPWGTLLKPYCLLDGTCDSSLRAFSSSPPLPGRPPSSWESSLEPLGLHSPRLIVSGLSLNRCKRMFYFSFSSPNASRVLDIKAIILFGGGLFFHSVHQKHF